MASEKKILFSFVVDKQPDDTFHVVKFRGREKLSSLYEFEILLMSTDNAVDFSKVLNRKATFTIIDGVEKHPYSGILSTFEQLQQSHGQAFYRAVLTPSLWWLSQLHHNRVFLDRSLPAFLPDVLREVELMPNIDFEFRLQSDYEPWEFVCQYNETHFNFFSRWLERDGLYYFFEQNGDREKAIITDSLLAHSPASGGNLHYSPKTGLELGSDSNIVQNFKLQEKPMPAKVTVKDWNYRKPDVTIKHSADVDSNGVGEVFFYGDHIRSTAEGETLAGIRAEEIKCQQKIFTGYSNAPMLQAGFTFQLSGHFRSDFNSSYLVTEIHHEGSQEAYLMSKFGMSASRDQKKKYYSNRFAAIPASVQFRPERATKKQRFYGAMNAHIDSVYGDQYGEVDDQGRYKVVLPFDLSGRKDGHASAYLRMMQPYVGDNHGMHMPLHRGTEVLLTFIDGDPDRPVIAGALPNPSYPSQVTSDSRTMSKLTTGGQNKMHIEDKDGSQRMLFSSPTSNSWVRIGAPNDPPGVADEFNMGNFYYSTKTSSGTTDTSSSSDENGISFNTEAKLDIAAGTQTSVVMGNADDIILVNSFDYVGGIKTDIVTGLAIEANAGWKLQYGELESLRANTDVTEEATTSIKQVVEDSVVTITAAGIVEEGPLLSKVATGAMSITTGEELAITSGGNLTVSAPAVEITASEITLTGSVIVSGDLTVLGTSSLAGDTAIVGEVEIEGATEVTGNVTIVGALEVE